MLLSTPPMPLDFGKECRLHALVKLNNVSNLVGCVSSESSHHIQLRPNVHAMLLVQSWSQVEKAYICLPLVSWEGCSIQAVESSPVVALLNYNPTCSALGEAWSSPAPDSIDGSGPSLPPHCHFISPCWDSLAQRSPCLNKASGCDVGV